MSHSLSTFITAFNGGLRPNRFIVEAPTIAGSFTFHCRAASLPTVTTSVISLPYRGRIYKIPGQRTFGTWSVTILDDAGAGQGSNAPGNSVIWDKIMAWTDLIQSNTANTTDADADDMEEYMYPIIVKQLNFNGNEEKKVVLHNAWPSVVGEIRFSQDDAESLCSFNVDFEYQYVSSYTSTST